MVHIVFIDADILEEDDFTPDQITPEFLKEQPEVVTAETPEEALDMFIKQLNSGNVDTQNGIHSYYID